MSVEMTIECSGLEEFGHKVERLDSAMKARVGQRLAELAESIKETAQSIVPVRTGYLRSTIFAEASNWTVKVGARAPYAAYVEFGTRFMHGRRFLLQSVEAHIPKLMSIVGEAINEAVTEANP